MSYSLDYYDNYISKDNWNENVPVENIYDIITKQSIRYFNSKDRKS